MSSVAPRLQSQTELRQREASDPAASAWVSANAGSGKTEVLAQRVIRLMLDGVKPDEILCLTYTKAAAAEMTNRVFDRLGAWITLADAELRARLQRLTGEQPSPTILNRARRLFADALETPGGLKIQTIHAFGERLLHLFPFDANAPAHFEVLDDAAQAEMINEALAAVIAGRDGEKAASDFALVAEDSGDDRAFRELLMSMLAKRGSTPEADESARATQIERLAATLGVDRNESADDAMRRYSEESFAPDICASIIAAYRAEPGKINDARAAVVADIAATRDATIRVALARSLFLRGDGEPAAAISVMTKKARSLNPSASDALDAEGARLFKLLDRLSAIGALERNRAIFTVTDAVLARYRTAKARRGALDFADLIDKTRALLANPGIGPWILYKLDSRLSHILVDEAQDTSEAQWDIIQRLEQEFTAGAGAREHRRTMFAVGDEKQSIYGFQGAAPKSFAEMRRLFKKRHDDADRKFNNTPLTVSFRSTVEVLSAVDRVFSGDDRARGLSFDGTVAPTHASNRLDVDDLGFVELWPLITKTPDVDPDDFIEPDAADRAVDAIAADSPSGRLARRIANHCLLLIKNGDPTGRPVRPGDIMILVRRRDAFFEAMVRALKDARVPVAGADRLDVGQHIAVMDLLAAARAALAPDDDLSLACALKSPLCGLTDDDLIAIAPRRAGSLSEALAASTDPHLRTAAAQVEGWRRAAAAKPFDFFSRLLGPDQGRRAFVARLGPEAGDAIDEFMALALEHERREAPSLLAFVHELETISLTVKRDLESSGDLVRVMTAHAAKGLEAKIVFLPDTCSTPTGSHDPSLFEIATRLGPALVWSERKADDPPAVATRRAAVRAEADDEYRRLLYVAMTRAEERLYIAGHHGKTGPKEGCWRNLVVAALRDHCIAAEDPHAPGGEVLRFGAPNLGDEAARKVDAAPVALPDWIARDAPIEIEPAPPIRPANALAGADAFDPTERQPTDATEAINRGLLVHRLLQSLPELAPSARSAAARRFLRAQAPDLADGTAEALVDEVLRVLDAPECAPLFGASARAEVAVAARIARRDRAPLDIAGRIDRLAETKDEIWIADFKTGAEPESVPAAYVAQLALYRAAVAQIYPDRGVRAFVLWTTTTRLCEIDASAMERALASI